ncbi:Retrovirus-related Pol polyprotein from type-1 retrotransposable element R1 [Araneus ventricosus]|uniref:Retrovirus-related Pol polyprotein from type-1 retrotransposable element R1 n=1 Tax=Araneus ventricosus TaxID=182803 RepID=A0A4Y2SBL2_ARAVE|nr:Retrovirus-related Pol polyprotein from type-1 retrotransposable element R1 [Araneus ventricosus]
MPNSQTIQNYWNIVQINLGRSRLATQELKHAFPDVYIIQEPYKRKGKIFGFPLAWKIVTTDPDGKTIIAIRNKTISAVVRHKSQNIVAVELSNGQENFTVFSIYFPPSMNKNTAILKLEEVIFNISTQKCIISGDINMRNELWGPAVSDHRAQDNGGPFVDFILKHNLDIHNNPTSEPTFEGPRGHSWIDITVSTCNISAKVQDWRVYKYSSSDHNFIHFKLLLTKSSNPSFKRVLHKRQLRKLVATINSKFPSLENHISQFQDRAQVEDFIEVLTKLIQQACSKTSSNGTRNNAPWWDTELEIQRKKTRAFRARFQRCKIPAVRLKRREIFKKEEAKYKWLMKTKARASFEELCDRITKNNPFELPYKLAANKTRKQLMLHSVNTNGGKVRDLKSTVEVIVKTLFPEDTRADEDNWHEGVRRTVKEISLNNFDQVFTANEIAQIIKIMPKKKAPGIDGITIEIIKAINFICPEILLSIFNKCLKLGVFPKNRKTAKLVLLNKTGKNPEDPKSYRPICLLPVMSKILDKLITQRITHHLSKMNLLNPRQHGFRAGKSCDTAGLQLWRRIQSLMKKKGKVCIVSLDVAGAFDNVWRPAVLYYLVKAECPMNLLLMIKDYLDDRQILFHHNQSSWTFNSTRGVPQGSCSGPLLWNLVADSIFDIPLPENCFLQAFADDLVLIAGGTSKTIIETKCNEVLVHLQSWGKNHKLTFNSSKTTIMPITFGGRLSHSDPPSVFLDGQEIEVVHTMRYLGVLWDSFLTFTEHFKTVRQKVDILTCQLNSVAHRFYSKRLNLFRRIYVAAIEPYILFGHGAWGHRLNLLQISLNSIQRRPLLKITGAFRTSPSEALPVIAGLLPLDLKAIEVLSIFLVNNCREETKIGASTFDPAEFEAKINITNIHPANRLSIPFTIRDPNRAPGYFYGWIWD